MKRQISTIAVLSLLLTPLTPMIASGQENQAFDPLPEGAQILSEKNGERKIQFKSGTIARVLSKEKQAQIKQEQLKKGPRVMAEEFRRDLENSQPADVIVPDSNPTPQVTPQPSQPTGKPVSVPGKEPKKKFPISRLPSNPRLGLGGRFQTLETIQLPRTPKAILVAALPLTALRLALGVAGPDPHSTPYQFPFTRNEVIDDYTVKPFDNNGSASSY